MLLCLLETQCYVEHQIGLLQTFVAAVHFMDELKRQVNSGTENRWLQYTLLATNSANWWGAAEAEKQRWPFLGLTP